MKRCVHCHEVKSHDQFYQHQRTSDGYGSWCKTCLTNRVRERRQANPEATRAYANEWNRKNPEKRAAYRRKEHLRSLYGVTPEWFEEKMAEQGECCIICSKPLIRKERGGDAATIDHDHETGIPRDILCGTCNSGLGFFSEDPDLLVAAAAYLMRWSIRKEQQT